MSSFLVGLVDVEVGVDLHLGLARPERAGEHRVSEASSCGRSAPRRPACWRRAGAPAGLSPFGHSSEPRAVGDRDVLGLEALDGGGDELRDAAHGAGLQSVGRVGEHDRGGGRRGGVGEQVVLGQHELHLGAGDALDAVDRAGDLALQRALVGDLVLEVGGAELLLVEELEARLGAAAGGEALAGERDARLGDLRLLDRQRGAVVDCSS